MAKNRSVDVRAAGALVWRRAGRHIEVCLVHRPRYADWSFPKGKLEPGESLRACCIREVKEESGLDIILGQPVGRISYDLSDGRRKEVRFWIATVAEPDDPSLKARPKFKAAPEHEIDEVRWVAVRQAMSMLTHEDDREMLGRLLDQWSDDKLQTTPILLVRHTRAKTRGAWGKVEETRPLTDVGVERAKSIAVVLSAYGIEELYSSPWKRTWDTVLPYSEAIGKAITSVPEFTEAAHGKAPKKVAKYVDALFRRSRVPIALSLHRPTLPTVMDVLSERTPHSILKEIPKTDPWLKTGEMIVAHVVHRRGKAASVVALEKFRPLADKL